MRESGNRCVGGRGRLRASSGWLEDGRSGECEDSTWPRAGDRNREPTNQLESPHDKNRAIPFHNRETLK